MLSTGVSRGQLEIGDERAECLVSLLSILHAQQRRRMDRREDFRALHDKLGLTSVMITHDMTEAVLLADRIAVMRGGKLLAQGTPAELAENDDPYVGELLGTPRRQAARLAKLLPKDGAA